MNLQILTDMNTGSCNWDIWYANMSIVSTDGTVTPINPGSVTSAWGSSGASNYLASSLAAAMDTGPAGNVSTHFYVDDHLGTAQLEFAGGGWPVWQSEYTPYGSAVTPPSPSANTAVFTGQERDPETADTQNTGLDFMNARYYSATLGRFTTPDPYLGSIDITDPQSLNRYTYALNNPLKFTDPSGLFCEYGADDYTPENGHLESTDYNSNENECSNSGGMWSPDGDLHVDGDFEDAVYSLRSYFTQQILSNQTNECQALASFVSTVQAIGNQNPMPAIIALTPKPAGRVEAGGDAALGVTTNRDGQKGFNATGGQSGFQAQYQNDQPDDPNHNWNGDQSHHFAAFFQSGVNRPAFKSSAASVWEHYQNLKSPNQGDIRLGDEAARLGAAWAAKPGDVGVMIRSQVCH